MSELAPAILTNPDVSLIDRTNHGLTVELWLRRDTVEDLILHSLYITLTTSNTYERFDVLDNSEAMEAFWHPWAYGHGTGQLSGDPEKRNLYAVPEKDQ